jgi:uncharacterized membrane protein
MGKSRFLHLFLGLILVFTLLVGFLAAPLAVSAADTTPTPTPTPTIPTDLKVTCDVPSYSDNSGVTFTYNVILSYSGADTIIVTLSDINPPGWNSTITYTGKEVSSIPIGPLAYNTPDTKTLSVSLTPNIGNTPDTGEYKMTLKANSGQFSRSIDLTAIVRAKYSFNMSTPDSKLNMTATAGKANNFTVNLNNAGTAVLENMSLSADKPSDWTITFSPDKVTSLAAGQTQQENIVLTPPAGKTVAGDYMITFRATNAQVSSSLDVRVTVETSSIWGVLSIVIIVIVIAGLAVLFLRLGRR